MIPDTKNGLPAMVRFSDAKGDQARHGTRSDGVSRLNSCTRPKPSTRWSVTDWRSFAMRTSTPSQRRTSFRSWRHRWQRQGTATANQWVKPADGQQCDPHHVPTVIA